MNQRVSKDEYQTGNRELVIFLKVRGVVPVRHIAMGRRKIFCYYRPDIVNMGLDVLWNSGEDLMVNIRDVFNAESWFNSIIHDNL